MPQQLSLPLALSEDRTQRMSVHVNPSYPSMMIIQPLIGHVRGQDAENECKLTLHIRQPPIDLVRGQDTENVSKLTLHIQYDDNKASH
jgi:hypothetical protein